LNKELDSGLIREIVGAENIRLNESMKNHTSFRLGGPADILVMPDSRESLGRVLSFCKSLGMPVLVIGNGTNLIVRDKGIRGVVIKIYDRFNKVAVRENIIEAEAGLLLSRVSNIALENGLSGLEFASGIPGTLGGAVVMNAGAYGPEMKDVVVNTEYMDMDGNIRELHGEQHKFGYRTSVLQKEPGVVLNTQLQLKSGNRQEIKAMMNDLNKRRKERQPLEMPSAGSVFRRPEGYFAGKLIEDCGLKGFRIGGAEVSQKHAGFIVNTGNASARDVVNLIGHIQASVKTKFGVELETEVKIVGEE